MPCYSPSIQEETNVEGTAERKNETKNNSPARPQESQQLHIVSGSEGFAPQLVLTHLSRP